METKSLRNAIAVTSLLVGLAGASSAQAGPPVVVFETLGAPATATDVYLLTCPIGTTGVSANVEDLLPVVAPLVSLLIFKPLPLVPPFVSVTTDLVDGNGFPSAIATLGKGSGQYSLYVAKNGWGAETYRMVVHCNHLAGAGVATPPFPSAGFAIIQDQ